MTLRRKNWRAFLYILPCMVALACPSPGPDGTDPPTADSPADSAPERAESPPAEHTPDRIETAPADPTPEQAFLSGALTLHASFDEGPDADFALGDPLLYTVPLRGDPDQAQPGLENADVEIVTDVGRFGNALRFIQRNAASVFYWLGCGGIGRCSPSSCRRSIHHTAGAVSASLDRRCLDLRPHL